MNLAHILGESEYHVSQIITQENSKESRRQIPAISEIYSSFYSSDLIKIKEWDKSICTQIEGVYSLGEKLLSVTRVNKGQFKYVGMFCSGILEAAALTSICDTPITGISESIISDELEGTYICILKKVKNTEFYEPEAFTYLIRDDYFNTENKKNIIPFLALPGTIPIELIPIWVYLGLKHFSTEYLPSVEFSYLIETKNEENLVKTYNL